MSISSSHLRSLALTSILSFSVPVALLGGGLGGLLMLHNLPGFQGVAQAGFEKLWAFLTTFGGGYGFQGIVIIGLTSSFVATLYGAYTFYGYQKLDPPCHE